MSMMLQFSSEEAASQGNILRQCTVLLLTICLFVAFFAACAWGAIPAGERTVLQNLYTSTNGAGWRTYCDNWNGSVGTECTWNGVTCDAGGNHVTEIYLYDCNLTGTLPSLSGLTNLQDFIVAFNQLTGSIPSLSGLTNLQDFNVGSNQLTGSIPSLSGLTNLQYFEVYNNQLTGSIPALSGLTNLHYFYVDNNQLTGSIPSLSGLTNLYFFDVYNNQLTGSIPSLSGLTNLYFFDVYSNQLTGLIPALSGLTNLQVFDADYNQLTGSIPALSGLTNLKDFQVYSNQLTGAIPSLSDLTNLQFFQVNQNYLSGDVPAVPNPSKLVSGNSTLCPNDLNATSNSAWDAATGLTPWYQNCTAGPAKFSVNYDGNGNTGGSLPDTGSIYTTGVTVTVLGNTGALYRTGYSFNGWNTAANSSGASYVGGNTFVLGSANVVLYAQWTATSASPVRIYDTGAVYPEIQDAYNHCANEDTIEAWDGLRGQNLVFNNPVSFKLIGGYDSTFTTNSGATLVSGSIEIGSGSIEIANFIIQ